MHVSVRTAAFILDSQYMFLLEQLHSNGTDSACFCQNSCMPVGQSMQVSVNSYIPVGQSVHVSLRTAANKWDSQCMFVSEELHSGGTVSACFCQDWFDPVGQCATAHGTVSACFCQDYCKPTGQSVHTHRLVCELTSISGF